MSLLFPVTPFFLPRRLRLTPRRVSGARCTLLIVLLAWAGCAAGATHGGGLRTNLALPTLEGRQLWDDVGWDAGWRVQRHVWTGHARLLDPGGVRRAWGGEVACLARLADLRATGALPAPRPRLVVLVHGLGRSHASFARLRTVLEAADYDVLDHGYASTRGTLQQHAAGLATVLGRLEGAREVSFVTHSLGGLVLRALLADEDAAWRARHRLGRAVTLAAPHAGAEAARRAHRIGPLRALLGPSLAQLADGSAARLPDLPLEHGAVAGARGTPGGWNPLIAGDDDGCVAVAEALPASATERRVVRALHTFVMDEPGVVRATVGFLETGAFPAPASGPREPECAEMSTGNLSRKQAAVRAGRAP